ncbi:TPA: hypothetical protein ACSTL1_001875 [Serratia fonticola]
MWYKTGTISLTANNATVTGTGTAWADAKFGVMPGMILLAPDNKLYEVKQVNSNTSLTLNSNYAGTTASGQSYAIITTYEGDISQFSARFAAMLTFFQGSRNDTVSWFTGSGDMTFTKDDGTKLTVPTLAKIQTDYVSRSSSLDQSIASSVLFSKPVRLSTSSNATGFIPASQGAWVSWNRKTSADDGLTGATDFITHKGAFQGGWNFWNSNGTTADLSARISAAGYLTTAGGVNSTGDQIMQAGSTTSNLLLRFRDAAGIEKGAVYSDTSTGQMTIRWGGASHSLIGKADGQLNVPRTLTFNAIHSQPTDVPDVANLPVMFRGHDTASFDRPNNFTIGTWFGFSIVPTGGNEILGPGVERGKPVFFVNSRAGTAHVLNNLYVGDKAVIKVGDFGLGVTNSSEVFDFTKNSSPAGIHRAVESQNGAPAGGSAMVGVTASISGSYSGHIYTSHGATPGAIKLHAGWTRSNGTLDFVSAWHSGNTTVDSNGFIKKASPIVKLFGTGECELNEESQGVITKRISKGVYLVSGVRGFNADAAWGGAGNGIEIPVDDNKRPLIWIESKVLPDGDIEIRTYHRSYDTGPYSTRNIEAMDSGEIDDKKQQIFVEMPDGTPIDIPEGRFIDLRVEMPATDEPEPVF